MESYFCVRRSWRVERWWLRRCWRVSFDAISPAGDEVGHWHVTGQDKSRTVAHAVQFSQKLNATGWVIV